MITLEQLKLIAEITAALVTAASGVRGSMLAYWNYRLGREIQAQQARLNAQQIKINQQQLERSRQAGVRAALRQTRQDLALAVKPAPVEGEGKKQGLHGFAAGSLAAGSALAGQAMSAKELLLRTVLAIFVAVALLQTWRIARRVFTLIREKRGLISQMGSPAGEAASV